MQRVNRRKVVEAWRQKHGACKFDLKNRDIILCDGGLFSIEKRNVMRHKFVRFKPLDKTTDTRGSSEVVFTKEKYPDIDYEAVFWMSELEETIAYFKSMKRMLNKLGYRTGHKYSGKPKSGKQVAIPGRKTANGVVVRGTREPPNSSNSRNSSRELKT